MFYDERIENTKGIIAKRAIVISFFLTFILAEIHGINLLRNAPDSRYYWIVSFFMLSMLTSQNIFIVFDSAVYESGITTFGMFISYIFWIWLIINITVTAVLIIKQITKRRLK